jgi:ketosteroid isomerase-like protein
VFVKKLTFLTLCGLVLAWAGSLAAANNPKDEQAVTATLEAVAKATVDKDAATLDKIYAEEVTYSHSAGNTQTKAQVLKGLEGRSINESMVFSETTIRFYGDVALAKGICDFRNGPPGNVTDHHLNILWVLVRRPQGPFGWQIVARQTTAIEPPPAGRGGIPGREGAPPTDRGGAPAREGAPPARP